MILCANTLIKLREFINEKLKYRTGPELVCLFNSIGFKDSYGKGFPSRHVYSDGNLRLINGKPELDKCIKIKGGNNNYIVVGELLFSEINKYRKYEIDVKEILENIFLTNQDKFYEIDILDKEKESKKLFSKPKSA